MATIIPSRFTLYDLSAQKAEEGILLSTAQKNVIHNHRANAAENKLSLEVDHSDVIKFVQDEAFLNGQITAFSLLLESSEALEQAKIDAITSPED